RDPAEHPARLRAWTDGVRARAPVGLARAEPAPGALPPRASDDASRGPPLGALVRTGARAAARRLPLAARAPVRYGPLPAHARRRALHRGSGGGAVPRGPDALATARRGAVRWRRGGAGRADDR